MNLPDPLNCSDVHVALQLKVLSSAVCCCFLPLFCCLCIVLPTDGEEDEEADEHADAAADAATDAAAAAGGDAAADAASAGSAAQQQLGRSDSAADSSAYWAGLLKPRWEVLQKDEAEALEVR